MNRKKYFALFVTIFLIISGTFVAVDAGEKERTEIKIDILKKTLEDSTFLDRLLELLEPLPILYNFIIKLNNKYNNNVGNNENKNVGTFSYNPCFVSLPDYQVYADIIEILGAAPLYSYLSTELSGISGLYDVDNIIYPGWCIDYHTPLPFGDPMPIPVMLYSSYCPPGNLISDGWEEVNHIINNKHPDAGWNDIHKAITQFVNFGDTVPAPPSSSIADQMVAAAMANPYYEPGQGDVVAVIVDPIEEDIDEPFPDDEWGPHDRWQYTIIEVPVPEPYEGLTPGFWRNKGVKVGWPSPYTEAMTLAGALFVIPDGQMIDNPKRPVYPGDSLIDALRYKGGANVSGMAQSLLRAAVAALLNSAHSEVYYFYTVDEVIFMVNEALASEDRDTMEILKDDLDHYNNLGADEWW